VAQHLIYLLPQYFRRLLPNGLDLIKKGELMFRQLNANCLYPVPGHNRAPLDNVRLSAPMLWNVYYAKVVRFHRRLVEKVYDYLAFPVF
jgi:hypothetical protein